MSIDLISTDLSDVFFKAHFVKASAEIKMNRLEEAKDDLLIIIASYKKSDMNITENLMRSSMELLKSIDEDIYYKLDIKYGIL